MAASAAPEISVVNPKERPTGDLLTKLYRTGRYFSVTRKTDEMISAQSIKVTIGKTKSGREGKQIPDEKRIIFFPNEKLRLVGPFDAISVFASMDPTVDALIRADLLGGKYFGALNAKYPGGAAAMEADIRVEVSNARVYTEKVHRDILRIIDGHIAWEAFTKGSKAKAAPKEKKTGPSSGRVGVQKNPGDHLKFYITDIMEKHAPTKIVDITKMTDTGTYASNIERSSVPSTGWVSELYPYVVFKGDNKANLYQKLDYLTDFGAPGWDPVTMRESFHKVAGRGLAPVIS